MFLVAAMFRPKAVLLIDHPLGVPRAIHPVPTGMAACGVLAFGGRPRPFPRAAGCLFCHEKPYFSWFTEENINSIAHGGAKRRQGSKQRLCGVQNKAGLKFNAPPLQRRGGRQLLNKWKGSSLPFTGQKYHFPSIFINFWR